MSVFDEVRYDASATLWSLLVAAGSMALLGTGGWLWWIVSGFGDRGTVFLKSVVLGTLFSLLVWLVWLLVVYALLQRLAGVTVQIDQLLRAAGFATVPLALGVFMVVPAISFGIGLLALGGWLLATQTAIERASGASTGTVMLANLAGFATWVVIMSLLSSGSNQLAPGPFLAEAIWDFAL